MTTIILDEGEKISIDEMLEIESFGKGHHGIKIDIGHIYWCPSKKQILTHAWDGLKIFGDEKHELVQIA